MDLRLYSCMASLLFFSLLENQTYQTITTVFPEWNFKTLMRMTWALRVPERNELAGYNLRRASFGNDNGTKWSYVQY